MAIIGTFGRVNFEVSSDRVKTFKDYVRSGEARWEKHAVHGKKPVPEFVGPDLEGLTLTVNLSRSLNVDIEKELTALRMMRDNGEVHPFVIGKSSISSSYWRLTKIDEGVKTIDNKGVIQNAEVQLTIEEYPRPPVAQKSKTPVKKASTTTNNVSKRQSTGSIIIKAGMLNIRSGPSLKAKILKVARKGQTYKVYGTKKTDITWYSLGAGQYISASTKYVTYKKG